MQFGELADYFEGVGAKRLSSHEVDPKVSRGHEFQGVDAFRQFIGTPKGKQRIPVTYIWLNDEEPVVVVSEGTWYDSRAKQPHRAAEYRLYYLRPAEEVVHKAKDGDTLFLAKVRDGRILAIVCPQGSASETQLSWLLGVAPDSDEVEPVALKRGESKGLSFFASFILERIGLTAAEPEPEHELRDLVLRRFKGGFPRTAQLSELARELAQNVATSADEQLIAWLEMEERLFRALEKHIVGKELRLGFLTETGEPDVDRFVSFSLSVQNRRKSRAGLAFENHLKAIFETRNLSFSTQSFTEGRKRPDFLFPGGEAYHNAAHPTERLTMLGAKSTCKERWRQVLSEADRIPQKHLATLEPGISIHQLDEMGAALLSLVVPTPIQETYPEAGRHRLVSIETFIDLVRERA
jgi:hypothetical protein